MVVARAAGISLRQGSRLDEDGLVMLWGLVWAAEVLLKEHSIQL